MKKIITWLVILIVAVIGMRFIYELFTNTKEVLISLLIGLAIGAIVTLL